MSNMGLKLMKAYVFLPVVELIRQRFNVLK